MTRRRAAAALLCLALLFDVEVACSPLRTATVTVQPGRG